MNRPKCQMATFFFLIVHYLDVCQLGNKPQLLLSHGSTDIFSLLQCFYSFGSNCFWESTETVAKK